MQSRRSWIAWNRGSPISDLITAYAIACDEHDMPRLTGLFTADAAFDSPSGAMVAHGRDAIEAMFIELFKIRGPAFHWTHDHTITIDAKRCGSGERTCAESCRDLPRSDSQPCCDALQR